MSFKADSLSQISIYFEEQNNQLFQLTLETAIKKTEDDRKTATEEKNLRYQLLKNESRIRIDAMRKISLLKTILDITSDDDDADEISLEVKSHHVRFVSLLSNEIVKIFNEKFKSINLYKLRHMRDFNHEFFKNQNRIDFEKNDQLKNLKKTIEIFKNFEKTFYEIYFETFINYQIMIISLFVKISSNLFVTLIKFYQKILELVKLYD
jgi:hypothetical protein